MTQISRFEDIEAWKHARRLAKGIYAVTGKGEFAKDYGLRDQIRRAAVSIISNISEGFSRQTDQEFVQFLYIAKGSTSEVQSQLYIALDLHYISQEEFDNLYKQTDEVGRLIFGFTPWNNVRSVLFHGVNSLFERSLGLLTPDPGLTTVFYGLVTDSDD